MYRMARNTTPTPQEVAAFVDEVVNGVTVDPATVTALAELCAAYNGDPVPRLVVDAVALAVQAHAGQYRASGECYVMHPVTVAAIIAALGFDDHTVAAAACHDVVEDTGWTVELLAAALGDEVARLVDGVSKVTRAARPARVDVAAASMAKFLVAVADDTRVLVIKLADRLHNLRTAGHLPKHKQQRSATEALDVFSPVAHRLGLDEMRCEMEDLAFAILDPQAYNETARALQESAARRADLAKTVVELITAACAAHGVSVSTEWRVKHIWSIFTKAVRTATEVTALPDLIGVRVVVDTVPDCYQALGAIHTALTPVPGKFKDLIAVPRPTGYRSLHTTVLVDATPVEVQIRTHEMHVNARFGIAAHHRYKEGVSTGQTRGVGSTQKGVDAEFLEALSTASSPSAFLEALRNDLAPPTEIVVLTPRGQPIELPDGAVVIDFAYKVHTDIGNRCTGARVNGRLVPIRTKLRTGDVVEVLTSPHATPSRDWLDVAATTRAKEKIRKFHADHPADPAATARTELVAELRRRGVVGPVAEQERIAQLCRMNGAADLDDLVARMVADHRAPADLAGFPRRRLARAYRRRGTPAQHIDITEALRVAVPDVETAVARCCAPTSVTEASAYLTPARIVSVHNSACANYLAMLRTLPTADLGRVWLVEHGASRLLVEVLGSGGGDLLHDCTTQFVEFDVTVLAATSTLDVPTTTLRFELRAAGEGALETAVAAVRELPAVHSVTTSALARQ